MTVDSTRPPLVVTELNYNPAAATGAEVISILKKLSVEQGVTVITATHDHKMLANSDRVLWIASGQVDKIQKRHELRIDQGKIAVGGSVIGE